MVFDNKIIYTVINHYYGMKHTINMVIDNTIIMVYNDIGGDIMISFDPFFEWLAKHNRSIYELSRNKIVGGMTIDNIRQGKDNIALSTVNKICDFYHIRPSNVFRYIPGDRGDLNDLGTKG